MKLASLFYTIEHPVEMSLFYAGVRRAGIELNSEDHDRMVAARKEMKDEPQLPTLADVKALPIRKKTVQEIVAAAASATPAAAPIAPVIAPVIAAPSAPVTKQPSPKAMAITAAYQRKLARHLDGVNAARSMSRSGRPPLTESEVPPAIKGKLMAEALDAVDPVQTPGGVNAEAVATAKALAAARFGR
jgi:hypothetical protein